ncbi:hypothetical protein KIF24_18085 [Micromonospora sp. Llam7]|uniref:hypothetical protein n=1 Tax=Micromonospora tarapacensis TaxID=2835305 RepID=UPI001C83206F|nr:hypothetical protein [Micromonospora tarapacensis]MBX7267759.1 hypothetical protein [Micromonospora tarapacensis]
MTTAVAAGPAVRADIQISGRYLRDATSVHLVRDPAADKTFEIGVKEHFVLVRLDGVTSREEIAEAYGRTFGRSLGSAAWQQLLGLLAARGLIEGARRRRSIRRRRPGANSSAARCGWSVTPRPPRPACTASSGSHSGADSSSPRARRFC